MGSAMYYMLFFYVGYILQRNNVTLNRFYTLAHCIIATMTFIVLFPTLTLLRQNFSDVMLDVDNLIENQLIIKAIANSFSKLMQIIYAFVGLWTLLVWVGYGEKRYKKPLPQWIDRLGNLCFGVYLLQQFILLGLYHHTSLSVLVGPYLLPWIGFVFTLISSIIISKFFMMTKTGTLLIG